MASVSPLYNLVTHEDYLAYLRYHNPENVATMNPFICHPSSLPEDKLFLVKSDAPKSYEGGYWTQNGTCEKIQAANGTAGWVAYLDFLEGEAPNGKKSDWIMHVYLLDPAEQGSNMLCKLLYYQKAKDLKEFCTLWKESYQFPYYPPNETRMDGENEQGQFADLNNYSEINWGPTTDAPTAHGADFTPSDKHGLLPELGAGNDPTGSDEPNVKRCRFGATQSNQVVLEPLTSGFRSEMKSDMADKSFPSSAPENQTVASSSLQASAAAEEIPGNIKSMEHNDAPIPELGISTSHGGDKKETSKVAKF